MNQIASNNPYVVTAAEAAADERAVFIRRVYLHLAGALIAFATVCASFFVIPAGTIEGQPVVLAEQMFYYMTMTGWGWLIVIGAFMGVGYLANSFAHSGSSNGVQYLGLGMYVVAMAIVITPLLYLAAYYSSPDLIPTAAILTLVLFAGLTLVAFTSGVNFSFLRTAIMIGGMVALGTIVVAVIFGFTLGVFFAGAMILLMGMTILYNTSTIMHEYPTNMHVGASLALFSSVAMMFYYVLYLLMMLSGRD